MDKRIRPPIYLLYTRNGYVCGWCQLTENGTRLKRHQLEGVVAVVGNIGHHENQRIRRVAAIGGYLQSFPCYFLNLQKLYGISADDFGNIRGTIAERRPHSDRFIIRT